jgi:ankyrin repeat protein
VKVHQDVVSQLITSGANINEKNWSNQTALHEASKRGHLEVVDTLLNTGARKD